MSDIPICNPSDHDWADRLWLMWAGAYGDTKGYVWAESEDTAFEVWVEWLDDHAPDCLTWIDYAAAAAELELPADLKKLSDEEAECIREHAETDMTIVGHITLNNGDAILSWEWGLDEVCDEGTIAEVSARSEEERRCLTSRI